jgi:hypothetical protein
MKYYGIMILVVIAVASCNASSDTGSTSKVSVQTTQDRGSSAAICSLDGFDLAFQQINPCHGVGSYIPLDADYPTRVRNARNEQYALIDRAKRICGAKDDA